MRKHKTLTFVFVIIIILVLLFSVIGISVLYLWWTTEQVWQQVVPNVIQNSNTIDIQNIEVTDQDGNTVPVADLNNGEEPSWDWE